MPTPTYDLIEEKVLGSAATTVTFSSIPGTYKDIVFEVVLTGSDFPGLYFNGDTGNNYSNTYMLGNGTAVSNGRDSNSNQIGFIGTMDSTPFTGFANIMSYANTNVNKTVVLRSGAAGLRTSANVGLWRNTAAVTSVTFRTGNAVTNAYAAGCVFRLWGIAG